MTNVKLCGVVITDDGSVADVFAFENKDGSVDCYYNNDPYGIVGLFGFKGLKIGSIGVAGVTAETSDISPTYAAVRDTVVQRVRGDYVGAIYLEDGLLLIKDLTMFEAVIQGHKIGERPAKEYTEYIDVADIDDECDDYESIAEFFDILY